MDTIGVLDLDRLAMLSPKHWKAHEFCYFLHDSMLRALIEYEQSGAHNWVAEAFKKALIDHPIEDDFEILDFLKKHNLTKPYKHHIRSHLALGLTADMLHFLFEALQAFEKRKFAVGWALLRKPLKENLLFLCWMLSSEDEFIQRFESDNYRTLNGISKEKQLEIFEGAIKQLPSREAFSNDALWNIIYSKNHASGFEPSWQRATHLITSKGDLLKTEDYSLNLIFEIPTSDHHHDLLYDKLPYLMIFTTSVALECFNRVLRMNEHTYNHATVVSMGCYEALFMDDRNPPLVRALNKGFKEFLTCIHCKSAMKITKANAPAMYIRDQLKCNKCGLESAFPFYWLMAKARVATDSVPPDGEPKQLTAREDY